MIVHLPSMLTSDVFLARHPVPHVVVGYFDVPEEEPKGVWANEAIRDSVIVDEPGGFSVLTWAIAALDLEGDVVARMHDDWSSVWLAFSSEADALKVAALVNALPETPVAGESATAATFTLDMLLLERLRCIRDRRIAEIDRTLLAGGEVIYVESDGARLRWKLCPVPPGPDAG